jgi:hypothetical protein
MKTGPSFRQIATAFLAAGAPGASEKQRREASMLRLPVSVSNRGSGAKGLGPRPRDAENCRSNPRMVVEAWARVTRGASAACRCLSITTAPSSSA